MFDLLLLAEKKKKSVPCIGIAYVKTLIKLDSDIILFYLQVKNVPLTLKLEEIEIKQNKYKKLFSECVQQHQNIVRLVITHILTDIGSLVSSRFWSRLQLI